MKLPERAPLDALEIRRRLGHQPTTSARLPLRSSHSRRSPARFFASSMSISLSVWSLRLDRELHQPARARIDRGLAQLRRVHLAQALEARHHRLDARVLGGQALERRVALGIIERIQHLLAGIDAIQRRHRHVDVAVAHQRAEMAQEQRAQQRRDVLAVGIRVREDADLVIAQLAQVR